MRTFIHRLFYFLKNFGGHKSFLWGQGYPYFGLLVISPLGFRKSGQPYSHLVEAYMYYMFPEIHL